MNNLRRSLCGIAVLAAALLVLTGCPGKDTGKKPDTPKKDEHPTKGPHGGPLAELGDKEEYHAELMTDKAKKHATVYILDGDAKKAVPIKAKEITLTLKAEKPPRAGQAGRRPAEG